MNTPICEALALGELSPWAKQALNDWQAEGHIRLQFEKSISQFCSNPKINPKAEIAIIENTPVNQLAFNQIRNSNKKLLIIWMGEGFSKEDLALAIKNRVFGVFENPTRFDKHIQHIFQKSEAHCNNINQLNLLLQNLRSLFIQVESDIKDSDLASEIKTGLSKIGKLSEFDEFFTPEATPDSTPGSAMPLAKSQTLGEVLLTIAELERTGTLWVRGPKPNQEGKIDFIQGKITSAESGSVQQLKAIYRMFLWEGARFLFNRKNVEDCETKALIPIEMQLLVREGEQHFKRFEQIQKEIPPLHLELDIEPNSIQVNTQVSPVDFHALVQVVEYHHLTDVLDYSPLWDIDVFEGLIRLRKSGHIKVR